jgi:hypothetical protein
VEEGAPRQRLHPGAGDQGARRGAPARAHADGGVARGAGVRVEHAAEREVQRVEARRRGVRAPARAPDAQDARDVEQPERAALGRPRGEEPAGRIERERGDVEGALHRGAVGVHEPDAGGAGAPERQRELEQGVALSGGAHEEIVAAVRTRGGACPPPR